MVVAIADNSTQGEMMNSKTDRSIMMSRRTLVAGTAVLGGSVLAGLGIQKAEAGDRKYKFAFANVQESGELFKQFGDGFKAAADKIGVVLSRYNNNGDGVTALNNARLMIEEQPDIVFEYNGVEGIGNSLRKVFERAKVPYVAINVPVPGGHWFNLVNKEIGIDAAKIVAAAAREKGWTADNTTVLVAQAAAAGVEVNDCVRYFYITIAEEMGMQQVGPEAITATTTIISPTGIQVDGKGALEASYAAVKNVLQTIPKDRNLLLFAVNDDSAIATWRAVAESGRGDKALVAGLGGSLAALKELRTNPQWVGEGSVFSTHWGQYLLAMGVAIVNDEKPPPLTKAPQIVLTKKDVDTYYDAAGKVVLLPPLVPENRYLAATGILQKFGNVKDL
ncbi:MULTISPECIES: sugar ABC transporter substrate-binding protein [unclassified Bradyrhizobium]|uniref:sugar ABC transporter substrate-binding protein n=1 Tax=Bradyrhizobium sp. USDA 4541 TaxID=2817704 RepID=UPI0020A268F1|nr:substrate-binding domain-containing protein [Bradyrhizobium sp. USDA 4541]MCP1854543.1 ribose transport system substrate-binding protein [Bradyrhizobium sp. USDA 4541]